MKVDPFLQIKKFKHQQELSRQPKSEVEWVSPRAKQSPGPIERGSQFCPLSENEDPVFLDLPISKKKKKPENLIFI